MTTPSEPVNEPAETSARRGRWAKAARVARRVYLVALGAAIVWGAVAYRDEVVELFDGVRPGPVVAAAAASFGLIVAGSMVWRSALAMLGHRLALHQVVLATARSLPARYVPLGVTYAAGRIGLLAAAGTPLAPLTVTAGAEMMVSAAVALTVGIVLLAAAGSLGGSAVWIAAALVAAAVAVCPLVAGPAVTRLLARYGAALTITRRGYVRVLGWSAVYWTWAAATFTVYLQAFPAADSVGALEAAGAFMVAWAVGFLAVFAPQGIGVAELGLVALLASENRSGIAFAGVFAGYRIVLAIRDAVAASAAEIIAGRQRHRL